MSSFCLSSLTRSGVSASGRAEDGFADASAETGSEVPLISAAAVSEDVPEGESRAIPHNLLLSVKSRVRSSCFAQYFSARRMSRSVPVSYTHLNVTFFDTEEQHCVEIPEKNIFVYGLSFEHKEVRSPLYDEWKPVNKPGFHVLLAHGGDLSCCPMDFTGLAAAGFDYVALGHSHKPHTVCRDKIAYSGSLEPLDRNDLGKHGYIQGEYEDGNVKVRLVPCANRSYQNLVLNVDRDTTQYKLCLLYTSCLYMYSKMPVYTNAHQKAEKHL